MMSACPPLMIAPVGVLVLARFRPVDEASLTVSSNQGCDEAVLSKTFNLGLDVGRATDKRSVVRLRLAKALTGVAEANALAAESIALERGELSAEQQAQAEALALHAAAFSGMPEPVFHLAGVSVERCASAGRVGWLLTGSR